jgi:hypothetical protein
MGTGEVLTDFWWGNQRKRGNLEALCVNGGIILQQMLNKLDGRACTGFIWLRKSKMAGCCENGHEPSGSIKFGEFD